MDQLGSERQRMVLESRAHVLIEIALRCVEDVVGAAAGDAMPRIQEALAAGDQRARGGEEPPVTAQEAAGGVDHHVVGCDV